MGRTGPWWGCPWKPWTACCVSGQRKRILLGETRAEMAKKAVRVSVSAVVILSAVTWLMISTISEGAEYYKTVDEVMADPQAWQGKRLQVHGFVLGDPMVKTSTLEYRFTMHHNGKVINAEYTG